jgi:DNA-binding MarR family transcriptional regulator
VAKGRNEIPKGLQNRTGFLLRRCAKEIHSLTEEVLDAEPIITREFGLLCALESDGAMSQRRLCRILAIDKATMVQIIDHLEDLGLVQRQTDMADRRLQAISITPKGRRLRQRLDENMNRVQKEFLGCLKPQEWLELRRVLTKLIKAQYEDN